MPKYVIVFILVVISISSCQKPIEKTRLSVNGTWESLGSGWVLQIKDSTEYSFYDITSISCLPHRKGNFKELQKSLTLKNDTLNLLTGVITYKFTRAKNLPELCQNLSDEKNRDPVHNFEVFSETVKDHYAFFELNNINWNNLYNQQKRKLTKKSTEVELYQVIQETLELLNDNHAYLEATDEVYTAIESQSEQDKKIATDWGKLPEYGDFQVAQMVAEHHIQEEMTKDSWLIQWGKMTDDIGFIQVKAMWLYADLNIPKKLIDDVGYVDAYIETKDNSLSEEKYANKEQKGVSTIMNRAMNDLRGMDAIVIDIRFNGGGQDIVSFEILSQFVPGKIQVATQKLRFGNEFSPVLPLYIEGKESTFTKPVYVLTSQQTGSAAEAFSIATMALDNIKRIGSNTAGALSTELQKRLPNGWHFSISNEIYMDNKGKSYENIGIPVDYHLNYPKDRQAFFRSVVNDLEADKRHILEAIDSLKEK